MMPVVCAIVHRCHLFVCCGESYSRLFLFYKEIGEGTLVLYKQCQTSVAWKICHRNHHLQAAVSRAEHWATESSGGPIPHSRNGVTDTQAAA